MQRSPGIVAAGCVPNARARVVIKQAGPVELMTVEVSGLPANTDFDLFVIQVPNAPFGVSWYQGDLETNAHGRGHQTYVGRFSVETFAIALNTAPAPVVHTSPPFPDAASNPPFAPVHTYHLGLWFNLPADAARAGCPGATTPFNGEHNAGVQVPTRPSSHSTTARSAKSGRDQSGGRRVTAVTGDATAAREDKSGSAHTH